MGRCVGVEILIPRICADGGPVQAAILWHNQTDPLPNCTVLPKLLASHGFVILASSCPPGGLEQAKTPQRPFLSRLGAPWVWRRVWESNSPQNKTALPGLPPWQNHQTIQR